MAASPPTNQLSPTQTLQVSSNPISEPSLTDQTNAHDSTTDHQPSDTTSTEDADCGEKRKREDEDPSQGPLWKTSLCSYFRRNSGSCSHGGACRYAHGEEELRPRPDSTWDPTSERAKKVKKNEEGEISEVMMTEDVAAEEDGDGDGNGNDDGVDPKLSKCLVHLPGKWRSENLISFLTEQIMGNVGSNSSSRRRQQTHPIPAPAPPQPEVTGNRYVFAAATPYPNPNPVPFYQYPGYCPPPPVQTPYAHHYRGGGVYPGPAHPNWASPHYHCGPPIPAPVVEHQKAVTIRNDVNVKKETLRVELDEENPGKFLVAFTFDAIAPGSITVMFFAKEDIDCHLIVTKESLLKPVTVPFEQGLGQKFRQPSGTGIDFSMFEEAELTKSGEIKVYPLVVKAEACPVNNGENESNGSSAGNSQITQAVFENKGEHQVRVMKQILWVNQMRYELQEIYGIGNTVEADFDGNECVICLSEPRDTALLPCRHMCMCSGCAKILKWQIIRCPICRQPVDRLLEIKVSNGPEG